LGVYTGVIETKIKEKIMNEDDLTYGQIKQAVSVLKNLALTPYSDTVESGNSPVNSHPFKVGESYLIRTVTMIQVGRLEAVYEQELILSSASWVADTGRFYDALKEGKLSEVEPFQNDVVIGRGAIVDLTIWTHKLPTEQK